MTVSPAGYGHDAHEITASHDLPILQFSAAIYFAEEEEGYVLLDVQKLGGVGKKCSVTFDTDKSPYEMKKFRPTHGTLNFSETDHIQTFAVQLIMDDNFDSTLEFGVTLTEPIDHIIFNARILSRMHIGVLEGC